MGFTDTKAQQMMSSIKELMRLWRSSFNEQ